MPVCDCAVLLHLPVASRLILYSLSHRDANGFKCHLESEGHLSQMKLFSEHASSYLDQYSDQFHKVRVL